MTPLGDADRPFHLMMETAPGYPVHYLSCAVDERINELFSISIEAIAETKEADFDAFIGQSMSVHALMDETFNSNEARYFNGIITDAVWQGPSPDGQHYRLTLEPWLSVAARRINNRIFHDLSVEDILTDVFDDYWNVGADLFRFDTSDKGPTLEYCVQYGESDLTFIRRMLERFGWSFYFEHSETGHKVVVVDRADQLPQVDGQSIRLEPNESVHGGQGRRVATWSPQRRLVTGAQRIVEYDFKDPKKKLDVLQEGTRNYKLKGLESFQYPGNAFRSEGDGKKEARARLNAHESGDSVILSSGIVYGLAAGMTFALDSPHFDYLDNQKFICIGASHTLPTQSYHTGNTNSSFEYSGNYIMVPVDAPFGPQPVTPKPVMPGPQTARVEGDGTTHCDEHGRVKVQFHWDTDRNRSMWCRVSQAWAGPGWGAFFLPRLGMEVIVEFINGDPDHPIITGCVYNGANKPPYELPANASRSTVRTQTVDGKGTNELRFEDKAGAEEIFLMAQKDLNLFVENDSTEHVLNDKMVRANRNMSVAATESMVQIADKAMQIRVGEGKSADNIAGTEDGAYAADALSLSAIEGASDGSGDLGISATNNLGLKIAKAYQEAIGTSKKSKVGTDCILDAGSKIELKAGVEIKLSVGSNSITITNTGIKIDGINVEVMGVGGVKVVSPSNVDVTGGMIKLSASVIKLN